MNCTKCHGECFINEWEGWVWECYLCGFTLRDATDEEITINERT